MLRYKSILTLANIYRQVSTSGSSQYFLVTSCPVYKFDRRYIKGPSGNCRDLGLSLFCRQNSSSASNKPPGNRRPPYTECQPGTQRVNPQVQKCRPNPYTPAQPPDCAREEGGGDRDRNHNKRLLAALLLTTGTLYAFWKLSPLTQEEEKEVVPKVSNQGKSTRDIPKIPATSKEIPSSIPYLLIGGGTASFSAFRSIKSLDPKAKVLVISNESSLPYMRPPLSKEMWFNPNRSKAKDLVFKQWNNDERSLFYEPEDFYIPCKELGESENGGVAVARGWNVEKVDVYKRIAYLDDGHEIKYDKCLLATGAKPKNLKVFSMAPKEVQDKVMLYRQVPDFLELENVVKESDSIAIVGGSFLGSELACALARKAKLENPNMKVYQLFKEQGNMHKILPGYLSRWVSKKVENEGVIVMGETEVKDAMVEVKDKVTLSLSNGKQLSVNKVVVAVGVEPNTDLADKSELELEPECGGFHVNAELEARSHLFAAGDCACFYDVKFGRRRVDHHDHAVVSGRLAGENMVGAGKPYLHQPMFWSDLGPEVGFEAIGIVDASLPTVGVFAKATAKDNPKAVVSESGDNIRSNSEAKASPIKPSSSPSDVVAAEAPASEDYGKGVIFYLRDEMVVGILLWNVYSRMSIARRVLKDERKYDDLNEVAKLFNIFDD